MHHTVNVQKNLIYLGGNDRRIALFESAFPVPRGVSYNSYLLLDQKTVLFDTVDSAVGEFFLENLAHALGGRPLDYLIVSHMEPDHSSVISRVISLYPEVRLVYNQRTAVMLKNYIGYEGGMTVKEGEVLETGAHTLKFVLAPLVHWPEVMFTYDAATGTLFSADAFGTFGALGGSIFADEVNFEQEFLDDARRYYFNIVGKYGAQVQNVLKKLGGAELKTVCPLHGPIWRENIGWFLEKYALWSSYRSEEKGVAVFYASVYGHTQNAAELLAGALAERGVFVKVYDVSATDKSILLSEAFRYSHAVFLSTTYNGGVFDSMESLLRDLTAHGFKNRAYGLVENGSWAPQAGSLMQAECEKWKESRKLGETVTILSAVTEENAAALKRLAEAFAAEF